MNAREWADAGLDELLEELVKERMPLDVEKAGLYIRAGYGKGYTDGLAEQDLAIVREVLEFSDELALRVPVS